MSSARQAAQQQAAHADNKAVAAIDNSAGMANFVQQMMPKIADSLPRHFTPDRMARIVTGAIRRSEIAKANGVSEWSLTDCTPESFLGAVIAAATKGLEPGTEEAWLVPFRNKRGGFVECQMIPGYQGLAKLFWQNPRSEVLDSGIVHERDEFTFRFGTDPMIHHVPAAGDRGDIVYYYAIAGLAGKKPQIEVLTPAEVRALRGKEGPNGGIRDPQHWMERKTVLVQALKLLPKHRELADAIEQDEMSGTRLYAEQVEPLLDGQHETVPNDRLTAMWDTVGQIAGADKSARLVFISQAVGREITSSADLTLDEVRGIEADLDAITIDPTTGEVQA